MESKEQQNNGFHAFIRGIILFGFTMLMLSLILSGNIKYYIAPKMMPFIYFALVVFLLLSIIQIIRSTPKGQQEEIECACGTNHQMSGSRLKKFVIYSIFVLPLLMGFMLPEKVLDSSVASKRGVQLGSGIHSKLADSANTNAATSSDAEGTTEGPATDRVDQFMAELDQAEEEIEHYTVEDTYSSGGFLDYYDERAAELLDQEHIVITDENYLDMMAILDLYLEELKGKTIEIVGFTYRELGMKKDELVAARFSMTCCTADSAVYGLLVKGEETRKFENDTWIKVQGTLAEADFNGWIIPSLQVQSIIEVPKPDSPYVYPSFF